MKINPIGHLVKTNPIQTQSNPIAEKPKMNANIFITKDYENEPPKGSEKTNPIKPCPERSEFTLSLIEGNGPISNPTSVFLLMPLAGVWQNISAIRKGFVRICIQANGKTITGAMSYEKTVISWRVSVKCKWEIPVRCDYL